MHSEGESSNSVYSLYFRKSFRASSPLRLGHLLCKYFTLLLPIWWILSIGLMPERLRFLISIRTVFSILCKKDCKKQNQKVVQRWLLKHQLRMYEVFLIRSLWISSLRAREAQEHVDEYVKAKLQNMQEIWILSQILNIFELFLWSMGGL